MSADKQYRVRCKKSVYSPECTFGRGGWTDVPTDRQYFTKGQIYEAVYSEYDNLIVAKCDDEGDSHEIAIGGFVDDDFIEYFEIVGDGDFNEQDAYDRAMSIL